MISQTKAEEVGWVIDTVQIENGFRDLSPDLCCISVIGAEFVGEGQEFVPEWSRLFSQHRPL